MRCINVVSMDRAAAPATASALTFVAVLLNEAMLLGYERDWCARQATCSTIKFLLGLLPKQWAVDHTEALVRVRYESAAC